MPGDSLDPWQQPVLPEYLIDADGTRRTAEPTDDLKPPSNKRIPVRAWLSWDESPTRWQLTLEGTDDILLETEGSFPDLAEQARAGGAEEYWVWSGSRLTFEVQDWPLTIPD